MGRLTAKDRDALPKGDFAGPGRSYPVNDKNHARFAKAMASAHLSGQAKERVDEKADRELAKKRGGFVKGKG